MQPMNRLLRAMLAIAGAALLAIALAAAAGANELQITPAGSITAVALGSLSFSMNGRTIQCDATLDLEIEGTAEKTEGVRFGEVTGATATECDRDATVTFLGTPWTITYQSITGELPSEIAELLYEFRDAQVLVAVEECSEHMSCLYRGDVHVWLPLFHILMEEPYINQLMLVWEIGLPLEDDRLTDLDCPLFIPMLGQFQWEPTQTIMDM